MLLTLSLLGQYVHPSLSEFERQQNNHNGRWEFGNQIGALQRKTVTGQVLRCWKLKIRLQSGILDIVSRPKCTASCPVRLDPTRSTRHTNAVFVPSILIKNGHFWTRPEAVSFSASSPICIHNHTTRGSVIILDYKDEHYSDQCQMRLMANNVDISIILMHFDNINNRIVVDDVLILCEV